MAAAAVKFEVGARVAVLKDGLITPAFIEDRHRAVSVRERVVVQLCEQSVELTQTRTAAAVAVLRALQRLRPQRGRVGGQRPRSAGGTGGAWRRH